MCRQISEPTDPVDCFEIKIEGMDRQKNDFPLQDIV
jgi:hypothetical protein